MLKLKYVVIYKFSYCLHNHIVYQNTPLSVSLSTVQFWNFMENRTEETHEDILYWIKEQFWTVWFENMAKVLCTVNSIHDRIYLGKNSFISVHQTFFVISSHCSHSLDFIMIRLHRFLQVCVPECFIITLLTIIY